MTVARRILVIDDDDDCREALAELLGTIGHEVAAASTGAEGLEEAVRLRPDVVIIDLGLGDTDGCDVAKALRSRDVDALLIALTGWARQTDRDAAVDAGFDHFLLKPFDPEILESIVLGGAQPGLRSACSKQTS